MNILVKQCYPFCLDVGLVVIHVTPGCLACGRPHAQHAVGLHYLVYSYIVFVLVLHRTWRRKQLRCSDVLCRS